MPPGCGHEWIFERSSHTTGPLRYGESLALKNRTARDYVRYGSRTYGINLVWSDTPVYQWKLLGGTSGTELGPYHNLHTSPSTTPASPTTSSTATGSSGLNLCWSGDLRSPIFYNPFAR